MDIKSLFEEIKVNHEVLYVLLYILLIIGFIGSAVLGRFLLVSSGAPPNFEIIMVITLLAALLLRSPIAFIVPLVSMILSDILLGNPIFVGAQMNRIVLFTYSGFAMIAVINIFNKERFRKGLGEIRLKNIGYAAGLGIGFVLLYDVWTNFGWWYLIYPHTAESFVAVFTAGIPFMINHLVSGVVTFVVIALPIITYVSQKHIIELPVTLKNIQKIPVAAVAIGLILLSFTGTAMHVPQKSEIWLEQADATSVKISIVGDGWTIGDNIVAYPGDTVFLLLETCSQQNGFSFEYTYYEQFDSVLIDSINNDENGDNEHYWQYYVNNDIPMVGCDKYTVSNGDHVEWRFETIAY